MALAGRCFRMYLLSAVWCGCVLVLRVCSFLVSVAAFWWRVLPRGPSGDADVMWDILLLSSFYSMLSVYYGAVYCVGCG